MSDFMFLYRSEVTATAAVSDEQRQQWMQKWMTWMKDLGAKGSLKDPGQPLEGSGRVVSGAKGVITDGPYAEAKDLVCGFTLIQANDFDQAVELTNGCPIFDIGGLVEVRPVLRMDM